MIFGTDDKLSGKEPFLSMLYHFSQEISKSDIVIVIGYGFGDKYLNDILFQRMKQNLRMRLVIVNNNMSELVSRIPELQREHRFAPIESKAKDALNDNKVVLTARAELKKIEVETPF